MRSFLIAGMSHIMTRYIMTRYMVTRHTVMSTIMCAS